MKISTMALFFGGALVMGVSGVALAACSSDSGTGNPSGGTDSGGTHDGTTGSDAGPSPDSSPTPDSAAEGSTGCTHGAVPHFHPSDGGAKALFCGFLSNDGGTLACDPHTQVCCVGGKMGTGFADPVCNTAGVACANGTSPKEIDCEDSNDCPVPGSICCLSGTQPTLDPACGYLYSNSQIGTHCITPDAGTSCPAAEGRICTSDAECPTGKTCTAFKSIYFGLGICQ